MLFLCSPFLPAASTAPAVAVVPSRVCAQGGAGPASEEARKATALAVWGPPSHWIHAQRPPSVTAAAATATGCGDLQWFGYGFGEAVRGAHTHRRAPLCAAST